MGLLDFDNADSRLGLGLLAAASARSDGAGFGQRLAEAVGSVDQWKAQQQMQKMRDMQLQYQQALMLDHQQKLIAEQRANDLAARKQAALPSIFSSGSQGAPALNVDASLPPEMRTGVGYQPAIAPRAAGVDVQRALMAGYSPDEIEKLDKLRNVGLDKVERTVQGMDENNRPVTFQMDAFGRKVGLPVAEWKAPIQVNQGNKETFVDPVTLAERGAFQKFQSPDSIASNAVSRQNHKETLAQQAMLAGIGPNGQVSDNVESMAQAIASGKMAPPSGYAAARPISQTIMNRVLQINPQFDAADWEAKKKASRDFATGKQGQTAQSLNVAVDHLHTLEGLVTALNNNDIPAVNTIANFYSKQTGSPAVTNFDAVKKIVADEVTKAVQGSGGGVSDREEAAKPFMNANSPAQLNQAITQYKKLMAGQLKGLELTYKRTTKNNDFRDSFLEPNTRSVLDSLDSAPSERTIVKTGMYGGRKVVQYSDGTTDYAN